MSKAFGVFAIIVVVLTLGIVGTNAQAVIQPTYTPNNLATNSGY